MSETLGHSIATTTEADRPPRLHHALLARLTGIARRIPWMLVVTSLIAAAIVHIATTLVLASMTSTTPFSRLRPVLPVNRMVVLPPIGAGTQPLPFMMPHMSYAVCRFSAAASAIRIKARLDGAGWTLSLHNRRGDNVHLVTADPVQGSDVQMILVPPGNRFLGQQPEALIGGEQIPEIKLDEAVGLAIIRAPLRGRAFTEAVNATLATAICEPLGGSSTP